MPRCWSRTIWSRSSRFSRAIKPMPAVFDQHYVKRLNGTHVKTGKHKCDLAQQVRADIQAFKKTWIAW